jgi:hypothetical protein
MIETREIFFECSSAFRGDVRTAVVRAWSADEAEIMFRDLLKAEGVTEAGLVTVERLSARAQSSPSLPESSPVAASR